jgi:hypothetical protein
MLYWRMDDYVLNPISLKSHKGIAGGVKKLARLLDFKL